MATAVIVEGTEAVAVARVRQATAKGTLVDFFGVATTDDATLRAATNARFDAIDAQYPDALDALLADLEQQIANGEAQDLDPDAL